MSNNAKLAGRDRNKPCKCGSGDKAKKCCIRRLQEAVAEALNEAREEDKANKVD